MKRRRGFAVAVAVLALAGCAGLPDHSSVSPGRQVGVPTQGRLIYYHPAPPVPGATKESIALHYLDAMLAFPQDPTLVRKFLTPTARASWHPDDLLTVYQSSDLVPQNGKVVFKAQELGTVDARGAWFSGRDRRIQQIGPALEFARVDGQWRIDNPPTGTYVSLDTFDRTYHQYSLYFWDSRFQVLAPDPVYQLLSTNSSVIATALVANLLQGPTPSMSGVVYGVVPPGTRLDHSVTVSRNGLAGVRLTDQVQDLSQKQLRSLAAQLSWTLRQPRLGINRIQITVHGRPINVPGFGADFPADGFTASSPSGFGVPGSLFALSKKGYLKSFNDAYDGAFPIRAPAGQQAGTESAAVSLSLSRTQGARVVDDGTRVVVGGLTQPNNPNAEVDWYDNVTWFDKGQHLLKPAWDNRGLLWLVSKPTQQDAVVSVFDGAMQQHVVDAPGIAGADVRSFAVSRDGTRFAAVVETGGQSHLLIATVDRLCPTNDPPAQKRVCVALTDAKTVANVQYPLRRLRSVTWITPTVVGVIAQVEHGDPQPYQIAIDGSWVRPMGGLLLSTPDVITGAGNASVEPVVGTEDGRLFVWGPTTQQWNPIATSPGSSQPLMYRPTYPG